MKMRNQRPLPLNKTIRQAYEYSSFVAAFSVFLAESAKSAKSAVTDSARDQAFISSANRKTAFAINTQQ
jgi:hypothetical protein